LMVIKNKKNVSKKVMIEKMTIPISFPTNIIFG
jgi:hypothetical protein